MSTLSEPSIKPTRAVPKRAASALLWRTNSILRINEQKRRAEKYEAMIQRFQIRRVEGGTSGGSKLSSRNIIIDKHLNNNRGSWKNLSFRRVSRKLRKSVTRITPGEPLQFERHMLPASVVSTLYGLTMLCAMHFQLFYLPFAPIFYPTGSPSTFQLDLALEILAIVNIIIGFNSAVVTKRSNPIAAKRRIADRYLRGWVFIDVISAIPIQLVRIALGSKISWKAIWIHGSPLVLLRFLRCHFRASNNQVTNRLSAWVKYSRYTHLFNIARLLWIVLVIAHYMACFLHLLDHITIHSRNTIAEQYIANYFYAVSLIHGQGSISSDWEQNLLATFIILVGSVIVATIFGNVAMLVSNFNANTTNYQRKMESVFATMEKMELPERLRDRIQQYYAHVWADYESLDGDLVKFQRELTHTLGLEVGLYKYMSLVNDIQFWIDCSPDFIAQIVLTLVVRVYLPDDYVAREGEICDEMFMVNRGVCEVTKVQRSPRESSFMNGISRRDSGTLTSNRNCPRVNSTEQLAPDDIASVENLRCGNNDYGVDGDGEEELVKGLLRHGQAFGEMSLLMNYGQPSSVRAVSFVEICVLERASFQRIISRYPVDRHRVMKSIVKNCIQENEIPVEWDQVCQDHCQAYQGDNSRPIATASDVVDAIMEKVDIERPDNSILYGFHFAATNNNGEFSSKRENRANLNRGFQSKAHLNIHPEPAGNSMNTKGNPDTEDTHNLCRKMLELLTNLTAAVERLERSQHEHQSECCKAVDVNGLYSRYGTDFDAIRSGAVSLESALSQQLSRTGSNYSSSHHHHPVIGHTQSEYIGSAKSSSSGKRFTISEHANLNYAEPSLANPTRDFPPPYSDTSASAKSMGGYLTPIQVDGPLAHRFVRVDAANANASTSVESHHVIASDPSTERNGGSQSGAAARRKKSSRVSTRSRASVDASHNPKTLRMRFLTTRLSNPSSARGKSWGITPQMKRASTEKEVTLADQLWERRRRQSRQPLPPLEASRKNPVVAAQMPNTAVD